MADLHDEGLVDASSGNPYLSDTEILAAETRPALPDLTTTYGVCEQKLIDICQALAYTSATTTLVDVFQQLGRQCNAQSVSRPPRWSGIGDDCSPFEFSIEIRQSSTELRLLVEAQNDPASPLTYWNSGMRLNDWLVDNYGCHFETFRVVQDLFEPHHVELFGVMGHGCGLDDNGRPAFKIYVNPLASGLGRDAEVVSEALRRIGCGRVVDTLLALRGPRDVFSHFSLDLRADPEARIKVYIKHFNAVPADLDVREAAVNGSVGGEWSSFCRSMFGDGQLSHRPIYTAYSVTRARPDVIEAGVLQLPVMPYIPNDQLAFDKIVALLRHHGVPEAAYLRVLACLSDGPLEDEHGLHSHVSFSRQAGAPRVAVYFGSRLYASRYGWLSLDPARSWPENCWPSPSLRRVPRRIGSLGGRVEFRPVTAGRSPWSESGFDRPTGRL